jgi:signal transduction histidine kinase
MNSDSFSHNWQNWAVFGIRWVLLIAVVLIISLDRSALGLPVNFNDMLVALVVGGAANLLMLLPILLPALHPASPYVVIAGDIAIAGSLTYLSGGEPLLMVMIIGLLILSGFLRLGLIWGGIQAVAVIMSSTAVLFINMPEFNPNSYLREIVLLLVLVVCAGLWTYLRDSGEGSVSKQLNEVNKRHLRDLEDVRERSRAISEMAGALNSTLSFDRILNTALDIGRLSMRDDGMRRLVSVVLLFRPNGEALEIANARGLHHLDESRIVAGKSGLIAQALDQCVPIIGRSPSADPELKEFVAMQNMQSSLVIPLRAGFDNYGVLVYASDAPNAFTADLIDTLLAIGTQATVAMQNAVLYRNLKEEKERIIEMEENARKALVRDLHDIPTQTISAFTMRLRIIQRLVERGMTEKLKEELDAVEEMAQRATEEIRHVLFKLRPLVLESQGLSAALIALSEKMQKTYKQSVVVRVGSEVEKLLDVQAQSTVFYLIEEAVNNARKYAQANMISVAVGRKGSAVVVRVQDNGVGFDMNAVNTNYEERGSFGMVNMRERAELLDGTLKIESSEGAGTTITVFIPLSDEIIVKSNGYTRPTPAVRRTKLSMSVDSRVTGQASRSEYTGS